MVERSEDDFDVFTEYPIRVAEIVHISPQNMKEAVDYLDGKLSNTEHAWEAQDQSDRLYFDNPDFSSPYRIDGSLNLMPEFN